jgi:hypothetical protein
MFLVTMEMIVRTNEHKKNPTTELSHEHKWTVIISHWQCEICGRTYG